MAKQIHALTVPDSPKDVLDTLAKHLGNYSRYFSVRMESSNELRLLPTKWEGAGLRARRPVFSIAVEPTRGGTHLVLSRRLNQPGGCFLSLYGGVGMLMTCISLLVFVSKASEWRTFAPFAGTAVGLTLFGLALRQAYYWMERDYDPEMRGIFEKAVSGLSSSRS